jgi:LCP family protein required for cell wall assembly
VVAVRWLAAVGCPMLRSRRTHGPGIDRWGDVEDRTEADPVASRRSRRWSRRLLGALGVVGLAVALVVGVSVWSFDRSIQRVDVEGLGGSEADGDAENDDGAEAAEHEEADPLTVLVLGSDSRENLTPEERRELGTGDAPGDRTEVVSLVRLSPGDDEVRVLNVPRDSRVERCDGSLDRINTAFELGEEDGRGGATCVVQTLDRLLGVDIDHVVTVDFGGFVEVVDELGGVTLALDEPLRDDGSHLDLPAGCVTLDGRDALAFVRARKVDDDYGRIARQHRLVEEVRRDLAELGVLRDLPRLLRVAETVAGAVELDSSLTLNRLQQLVREHRASVQGEVQGQAVPGEVTMVGEASMLAIDEERARELATWLVEGQDPAAVSAQAATGSATESGQPEAEDRTPTFGPADGEADAPGQADSSEDGPRTLSGDTPAGLTGTTPPGGC